MAHENVMLEHFVHEGFPTDGRLRWVRWIDGIEIANPSGTPSIQVLLSPLNEDASLDRLPRFDQVAGDTQGWSHHSIHVGSIQAVRFGSIFLDGRVVGQLDMVEFKSPLFDTHSDLPQLCGASEDNLLPKPNGWDSTKYPWKIIPFTKYPLRIFKDSFVFQFYSETRHLLIPCAEIFRVFCAPETLLANALLSGPWPIVCGRVMNLEASKRLSEEWEVGLRTGLTGPSAYPIAAYQWTDWGRRVTAGMVSFHNIGNTGWKFLKANIPYQFSRVRISGDGIWLLDTGNIRRFLMLRIRTVSFPAGVEDFPSKIIYRLDNFNTARSDERGETAQSAFPSENIVPAPDPDDDSILLSAAQPPSASSSAAQLSISPIEIFGLPLIERAVLAPSNSQTAGRSAFGQDKPTDVASAGSKQSGDRNIASIELRAGPAQDSRSNFAQIIDLLRELEKNQVISSWRPVPPPHKIPARHNGIVAWYLPGNVISNKTTNTRQSLQTIKISHFSNLKSENRRRTCLVAEITVQHRTVYLLEIERRATSREAYKFGLLEIDSAAMESTINTLLRVIVADNGTWPNSLKTGRLIALKRYYGATPQKSIPRRIDPQWAKTQLEAFLKQERQLNAPLSAPIRQSGTPK